MNEGRKGKDSRFRKKRSRILYEITSLIVVILVISGLVTFFLVLDSQNKLIDKSVNKVIETEASNMASTLDYMVAAELAKSTNATTGANSEQLISDMAQKKMTDLQRWSDQGMKAMVDAGLFNMENISIIVPPSAFTKDPFVMVSSDESLVYEWKVPDYIAQAMQAETPYLLLKEGLPELGLEGTQLVLLEKQESPLTPGFYFYFVSVIPMQEKIDSINAYYDQERSSVSLTLGLSVFLSIIAVVIIIFFLLSYLIRKRITEPIDELAADAEEIMEGNLDVDIKVHEGGEFQGLEQAFREMAESIRKYIAKSTGEE